jgi:hypothetical protein
MATARTLNALAIKKADIEHLGLGRSAVGRSRMSDPVIEACRLSMMVGFNTSQRIAEAGETPDGTEHLRLVWH